MDISRALQKLVGKNPRRIRTGAGKCHLGPDISLESLPRGRSGTSQ